jgi:8-oxo-dGTP pyrophosphatase MutT (NUDIX family)
LSDSTALAGLRQVLGERTPQLLPGSNKDVAAVAMLLRDDGSDLQILFIERTERRGDPWSGHIAFPGGRLQDPSETLRAAAERETREEIGVDLGEAEYLGRLDDLSGSTLPVQVSSFAYLLTPTRPQGATERESLKANLTLNEEVRRAFWFSLADLVDPERHLHSRFPIGGREVLLPAIQIGKGKPLLWGLTYRFVMQVVEGLGIKVAGVTS